MTNKTVYVVSHCAYCPKCGDIDNTAQWTRKKPDSEKEETVIFCKSCGHSSIVSSYYDKDNIEDGEDD